MLTRIARRPRLHWLGALACIASTFTAGNASARASELLSGPTDPRFVPQRGAVVPIDVAGELPLQVGLRGHVAAEVEFLSDLVDAQGVFSMRSVRVLWRVRDAQGRYVLVRGVSGADQFWNGVESPTEVRIDSFDSATGVCAGVVELPIGGHIERAFGVAGRHPMLPDGGATIEFALGWERRIEVEPDGSLTGVLAQGSLQFATVWPDVWIGNESPRGPAQVGDEGFEVLLTLRNAATSSRSFEVLAQPAGIATVLTPSIVVPAGEDTAFVSIRGERPGDFRLLVLEAGVLVARSSIETIVRPQLFGSTATPALWVTSAGLMDPGSPSSGWGDKHCVEGYQVGGGGNLPVWEFCYPCKPAPNAEPSCPGEGGGNWALWYDAYCADGDDDCGLAIAPVGAVSYAFSSKRETVCFTSTADVSVKPFGVGGGTSWTRTYSSWCCKYQYAGTGAGNVPGVSRAVCGY